MPVNKREARHILAERLGAALEMTPEKVEQFKYFCTASGYFRLPNHEGGIAMPGTKHYRKGKEYTYDDVPWKSILEAAESTIKRSENTDARTRLFNEVMRGLPGRKSKPEWDKTPENPNAEPTTPYSRYRTREDEEAPSNAQMLKTFGEAAGLDDNDLNFVSVQITWWDASGDDSRPASFSISGGVRGGRLDRNHTFADVPSHYARDRLMHYTLTQLDPEKHDMVCAALCPDLSPSQIKDYSKWIIEGRVIKDKEKEIGIGPEDDATEGSVLKVRDGNRGRKRASEGGEGDKEMGQTTKRTRTLRSHAK